MDLVSVIIPTYNRFKHLINAIDSVKKQTYKNIEIIVVNDCSEEEEYYTYQFSPDIKLINLEQNSKKIYGYACAAYTRNVGVENSNGKYIAFLDDDDSWLPNKISLQLEALNSNINCKMCSTEGYIGHGMYDSRKLYKKYNTEYFYNSIKNKLRNSEFYDDNFKFPKIWNWRFVRINNSIITSSIMIEKKFFVENGCFDIKPPPGEDYACWLKLLKSTNLVYIDEPCFFYDLGHGGKRWW